MSDDPLLRELTRLAREDQEREDARLGGRWDALTAGRLTPEEEEELRALTETSPEAAAAYEAFRPLGADFRARMAQAARFQLGPRAAAPRATRRRRRLRWSISGAALAAATLLFLLWPQHGKAPLPSYGLELGGDVHILRSETAEPASERKVFVPGNRLRLVLTPNVAVEGPVAASVFVLGADGVSPLAAPPSAISKEGAVRIEGEVGGDVLLPRGDVSLLVVVGRPGSLPDGEELAARLAESGSVHTAAWSAFKVPLSIEEEGGP